MKKTIAALSIIAASALFAGCAETATDDPDAETTAATDAKPKDKPKAKPIAVNAKAMIEEFEANELAADKKYKKKKVRVTGVVDKIDTEMFDDSDYTVLLGGGTDFEILHVTAYDVPEKQLATIKKGQRVTLECDFKDGGDLGVDVNHCKKIG